MNTISALMNRPQPMATSLPERSVPRTVLIDAKSMPFRAHPIGGMMIAFTSVVTNVPSDAPMTTPIARASALDFVRNALKPPMTDRASVLDDLRQVLGRRDPAGDLGLGRDTPDDAWSGRDDFLESGRKVRRIAVGQLGRRIDAGGL